MPYRLLVDSTGAEWQVWDIVPRMRERRHDLHDRRAQIATIPFADRRASAASDTRRRSLVRRGLLRGTFAQGWLCFENEREKRRLTPIPKDWTVCSDEQLEGYLRGAESAPRVQRHLTFADEEPLAEAG